MDVPDFTPEKSVLILLQYNDFNGQSFQNVINLFAIQEQITGMGPKLGINNYTYNHISMPNIEAIGRVWTAVQRVSNLDVIST
jgi:hypothetical protein